MQPHLRNLKYVEVMIHCLKDGVISVIFFVKIIMYSKCVKVFDMLTDNTEIWISSRREPKGCFIRTNHNYLLIDC